MSKKYDTGTKVEWDWGTGTASGTIDEVFTERVERTLKGSEIVRNGSEDNPAYLIELDKDRGKALKLHSELRRA